MGDVRELMREAFVHEPTSTVDSHMAVEIGRARNRTRRQRRLAGAAVLAVLVGVGAAVVAPRLAATSGHDRSASTRDKDAHPPGIPLPDADGVVAYARGFTSAPVDQSTHTQVSRALAEQIADQQVARDPSTFPSGYVLELRMVTEGNVNEPGVPRLTWVATYPGSQPVPWIGPARMSPEARETMEAAQCSAVVMIDAESLAKAEAMVATFPGMAQYCEPAERH